jgi:hypothetical protein
MRAWSHSEPGVSLRNRVLAGVGGGLLVLALLSSLLPGGRASPGPSPSSSYSTRPDGVAAFATLLTRFGRPVDRLRGDLEPGLLDAGMTVVVLDAPNLSAREARHLRRFVRSGGRLLAGGLGADRWLGTVLDEPPSYSGEGMAQAQPLRDAVEVEGVRTVRAAGNGSWDRPGQMVPLVGGGGLVLVATTTAGRGQVIALADPSPLQNRLLDQADNAALGLNLAGAGRTVRFLEGPHGYGPGEGLAALPQRWRLALAGLGLAAAVWLLARSRRLGPPEQESRPLHPSRRVYIDAMAATLARTKRPFEAAAPVRARARHILAERAGLPPEQEGEDGEELRQAAAAFGLRPDEIEAVAGRPAGAGDRTPGDEVAILAAGRALARLSGGAPEPPSPTTPAVPAASEPPSPTARTVRAASRPRSDA